ncbi:hypothetical protein ACHAWU_007575 [Discostella pseudostelligera]|uniref:Uncharacterized protein n=1 Tax=Discostella pseudostelligera TaxID=259834 RepID=A0ABD3MD27_9STRA
MILMPHLLLLLAISLSSRFARSFSSTPGYAISPRNVHFAPNHSASLAPPPSPSKVLLTRLHSTEDKQAEIAALEDRLRQLRDEAEKIPLDLALDERDDIKAETADSIMFSERWKVAEENNVIKQEENRVGGIANIVLALGLVVLIGIFAQVPIGEESLQKYQAIQGNPSRIDLGDLNPVQ